MTSALEMHHFYIGLVLLVVAWLFIYVWRKKKTAGLVGIAGVILVLDDLYQHWRQVFYDQKYRSPVNKIYRKLFGRAHTWIVSRFKK